MKIWARISSSPRELSAASAALLVQSVPSRTGGRASSQPRQKS
ncbi:MAG: hypothetical protein AB1407_05740 [Spirochaetota bacterium]